jgi:hypothetical protein
MVARFVKKLACQATGKSVPGRGFFFSDPAAATKGWCCVFQRLVRALQRLCCAFQRLVLHQPAVGAAPSSGLW